MLPAGFPGGELDFGVEPVPRVTMGFLEAFFCDELDMSCFTLRLQARSIQEALQTAVTAGMAVVTREPRALMLACQTAWATMAQ